MFGRTGCAAVSRVAFFKDKTFHQAAAAAGTEQGMGMPAGPDMPGEHGAVPA